MFVEDFAIFLQQNKLGRIGVDMFVHHLPASVKRGVLVTYPNSGIGIDRELHDFYQDGFTVIVRDTNITAAQTLADRIMALLPARDVDVGKVCFRYIQPLSLPVVFPRDDGAMFEVGIPLEFAGYLLN